ncbi:MAG: alpha-amylase family glycosyl hydrolase, partial [Ruminococcus sp.]|nr:alpha-amylase family glycosyl hydrolase [Ruminococcus sp.]
GAISVTAAVEDDAGEAVAAGGITVHIYNEGGTPNIYYWNSLPNNITTTYPGPKMTAEGDNYYRYSFSNVTKINFMTVTNGKQGEELSREEAGEWWYKNGRWTNHAPRPDDWDRTDLREDSIYFLITTRFYDGDKTNNVHCWEDKKANNPDSDTPWRGDFKGLIQRLDYIKALGFTAVWITPVVENCSGYDYHGYHAFDFANVDPRYESKGATFQDVIDAAHEKGLKIIQDVVWNHTGNFGEKTLCPMFNRKYSSIQDLGSIDSLEINPNGPLAKYYSNYNSLNPSAQYGARLACMKEDSKDPANNYHHGAAMDWETFTEQTGQIADDCVDVNTEN